MVCVHDVRSFKPDPEVCTFTADRGCTSIAGGGRKVERGMPIPANTFGSLAKRGFDDLDPKVVLPTFHTDFGAWNAWCDEVAACFCVVIRVDYQLIHTKADVSWCSAPGSSRPGTVIRLRYLDRQEIASPTPHSHSPKFGPRVAAGSRTQSRAARGGPARLERFAHSWRRSLRR